MTTLELTDQDAELFKQFRQHQEQIATIISSGALDVRKGQVILSLSNDGIITNIDFHVSAYIRKRGEL